MIECAKVIEQYCNDIKCENFPFYSVECKLKKYSILLARTIRMFSF